MSKVYERLKETATTISLISYELQLRVLCTWIFSRNAYKGTFRKCSLCILNSAQFDLSLNGRDCHCRSSWWLWTILAGIKYSADTEHQLHSISEGKDLTSIFENRNQIAQRFKICIVFFSSWILLESISVKH